MDIRETLILKEAHRTPISSMTELSSCLQYLVLNITSTTGNLSKVRKRKAAYGT